MKEWFLKFWSLHGERVVFMSAASLLGWIFIYIGLKFEPLKELVGAGMATEIGIMTLCLNKARSPKEEPKGE